MSESRINEFAGNKDKRKISEVFKLQQNFRTHAGVLNSAQNVIDLLYRFFPHTIDTLEPETSLISGECPVLLDPGNDENAIVTIFGNSGSVGGKMVGFGAEQVILVWDDDAKRDISDYAGNQALLLNIVECKGLEFQIFENETGNLTNDLQVELSLSFSEAAEGCIKHLSIDDPVPCDSCHGLGHPMNAKTRVCKHCDGIGKVTIPPFTALCSYCKGSGRLIKEHCKTCKGAGMVDGVKEVKVTIPAALLGGQL